MASDGKVVICTELDNSGVEKGIKTLPVPCDHRQGGAPGYGLNVCHLTDLSLSISTPSF